MLGLWVDVETELLDHLDFVVQQMNDKSVNALEAGVAVMGVDFHIKLFFFYFLHLK
jgi:hypothetical protein